VVTTRDRFIDPIPGGGPEDPPEDERAESLAVSVLSVGLMLLLFWILLFVGLVRRDGGLVGTTSAVLVFAHGPRLWARLGVRRLDTSLTVERTRVFPGEALPVSVDLHNRKLLPVRVRVSLAYRGVRDISSPYPASPITVETLDIARFVHSFERKTYRTEFVAPGRGVYTIGPASVYAGDITGVSERRMKDTGAVEIVVFPGRLSVTAPDISFQEYFGIHAAKGPVEDPAWYAGTREYSGNRPSRNIHWKASARLGVLQEKIFEPTSHRNVMFVLDVRGYTGDDGPREFEIAVEVIASLASMYSESGASVGIVTNGHIRGGRFRYLPLRRGPEHAGALLEILARVTTREDNDLERLLSQAGRGGTGYIYAGYSPDDRTKLFFGLPAAQRKRIVFLFSRNAGAAVEGLPENLAPHISDTYPSRVIAELVDGV
jgi:uncharacterized protein (DUF58 family)